MSVSTRGYSRNGGWIMTPKSNITEMETLGQASLAECRSQMDILHVQVRRMSANVSNYTDLAKRNAANDERERQLRAAVLEAKMEGRQE